MAKRTFVLQRTWAVVIDEDDLDDIGDLLESEMYIEKNDPSTVHLNDLVEGLVEMFHAGEEIKAPQVTEYQQEITEMTTWVEGAAGRR
jgi:hypothetical protein